MGIYITVIGKMTKMKVKESIYGQMEINIKDNGFKIKDKVMAHNISKNIWFSKKSNYLILQFR